MFMFARVLGFSLEDKEDISMSSFLAPSSSYMGASPSAPTSIGTRTFTIWSVLVKHTSFTMNVIRKAVLCGVCLSITHFTWFPSWPSSAPSSFLYGRPVLITSGRKEHAHGNQGKSIWTIYDCKIQFNSLDCWFLVLIRNKTSFYIANFLLSSCVSPILYHII